MYIQHLLEEHAKVVVMVERQKTECQTRMSPAKQGLIDMLKKAGKAAAKAEKEKER